MRKILEEAVAVGNATARAIWIHPRDEQTYYFKDSAWYTAFVGGTTSSSRMVVPVVAILMHASCFTIWQR